MDIGDVVVLALFRLDDAGDVDVDADRLKIITGSESAALGEGLSHERGVRASGPVLEGTGDHVQAGVVPAQVFGGDTAEGDDIEAGPAVVDCDLDGNDFAHALDLFDGGEVVFREAGGCRTEAVLPVDDQGGVVGPGPGDPGQGILHGFHRGEQKHAGRHPCHGEDGAQAMPEDVLESEGEHGTGVLVICVPVRE